MFGGLKFGGQPMAGILPLVRITTDFGVFTLTGQQATFSYTHSLNCGTGFFVLRPQQAQFTYKQITRLPNSDGGWFVEEFGGPAPRLVTIDGVIQTDPRDRPSGVGKKNHVDAYSGPTHTQLEGQEAGMLYHRRDPAVGGRVELKGGRVELEFTSYTYVLEGGRCFLRVRPRKAGLEHVDYAQLDAQDLEDLAKLAELAMHE